MTATLDRAVAIVHRHALDADDAAMLLEMLGLVEPSARAACLSRTEQLVQVLTDAGRPMRLAELRAVLGWPTNAAHLTASRAVKAGMVTRPKYGWYAVPAPGHALVEVAPVCGTWSAYRAGCQCDKCLTLPARANQNRASARARKRATRVKRGGRLVALKAPQHGRVTAREWGCQCEVCSEAVRRDSRERRRAERRAKSTPARDEETAA